MSESRICRICNERPVSRGRVCNHCEYLRKKASTDAWKAANPDRVRELARMSRYRRFGPARDAAVEKLGGVCQVCGFSDERALEIDHVNGGGTAERKKMDRVTFYKKVASGELTHVQLLCLNCHRIKSIEDARR